MFTTPVQAMTSLSLETALAHIRDELQARRHAVDGGQMLSEFLVTTQKQVGFTRKDGEPWVAPVSQIYAYPYGATVTHKTRTWRSLVPVNMSEPGRASDWVAKGAAATMADPAVVAAYDPDSGPAERGYLVKVDGTVYRSLVSDNRWSPVVFPDVWETVS